MNNYRIINLIVSSSNYPFELTISSCCGNFIAKRVLSTFTSFCLCTNASCIKLTAKYKNQTLTKTATLSSCRCQRIIANFNFTPVTTPQIQTFYLVDANYNLPIKNAILNFQ